MIELNSKPWGKTPESMCQWWIQAVLSSGGSLSSALFTAALLAKDFECGKLAEARGTVPKATWNPINARLG